MSLTTALAIYFLIWWVTLFAILPLGVRPPHEDAIVPGAHPGAPGAGGMLTKLLWNTVISGIIFGLFYWVYVNRLITLEDMIRWLRLS